MWCHSKIGFDDRLVTVIMIPVASFVIPIVFMGNRFDVEPKFTGELYLSVLIITTCIWLGNRYILIWARKLYPEFAQVKRRIVVQSIIMFVYTIAGNMILGFVLDLCGLKHNHFHGGEFDWYKVYINSNFAAIFCSLTVVAIYESIYFMNELRKSVEEKEMLKSENLKAQLSALKIQVNPHFLFNNLNTLSSVIPENPRQAVDFVQQLSKVYRHILEVRDENSIILAEELEVLKAYAFLLETRFGENIDININVPKEKLRNKIVPLSLQILMENAIKHNIVSSDKPLKIEVFTQNGCLVVCNNLQKKNQVNESTGIGLDNLRNRYRLLGNKEITVLESDNTFTVSIPIIEN
jgi:two-component system, LytTR family, sensor kinase